MHLEKIKKLNFGKYQLKIDNNFITTYDDVILKNNLLYQKEIDASLYEQLIKDHEYYEAYNKTINYILRKIRSIKEVKNYLEKFSLDNSKKDKIIKHLIAIGLLDDQKFAQAYIADKIYLSNDGPDKIKDYLIQEEIDDNIINETIAAIDSSIIEDKLYKLISKKIKSNHKLSNYQLKQKILLEMLNLGYDKDIILSILDTFNVDDNSILEKEYLKIYNKLQKKYSGYELNQNIKQKLYAKGFDINEINQFMLDKE